MGGRRESERAREGERVCGREKMREREREKERERRERDTHLAKNGVTLRLTKWCVI